MFPLNNKTESGQITLTAESLSKFVELARTNTKVKFGFVLGVLAATWGYSGFTQILFGNFGSGIKIFLLAAVSGFFAKKLIWPALHGLQVQPDRLGAQHAAQNFGGLVNGRQNVKSSLFRLILTVIISLPILFLGVAMLIAPDTSIMVFGLGLTILSSFIGLTALRSLASGGVVFYFDETGITIPSLFGKKFIGWSEVKGFSVKTINTYMYGFIKIASDHIVYVERHLGKKIKLPTRYTGINLEGIGALIASMEMQRFSLQRKPTPAYYAPPPVQYKAPVPRIEEAVVAAVPAPSFASQSGFHSTAKFGRRPSGFVSKS